MTKSLSERTTDHIIQRDMICDDCMREMPKGFDAVEDIDTARLYCSLICWEAAIAQDSDSE